MTVSGTIAVTGNSSLSTVSSSGVATLNSVVCTNSLSAAATSVSTLSSSGVSTLNSVVCTNALSAASSAISGSETIGNNLTVTNGVASASITSTTATLTRMNNHLVYRYLYNVPKNSTDTASMSDLGTSGAWFLIVSCIQSNIESSAMFMLCKCVASLTDYSVFKLGQSQNTGGASFTITWASANSSPVVKFDSAITYAAAVDVPVYVGAYSMYTS
jgi:hypothetical protein